ncbi:MAG: hypothetical protein ACW964_19175 [Candidatus Hodarchaeales archaeon]|jgi:hypothetical protein
MKKDLKANIKPIISDEVQQAFDLFFQKKATEKEKLFGRLVGYIKDSGIQVCVMGVPLFVRSDHDQSMGSYVLKLLREREVHANWLLVSPKQNIIADSVLAFVSVEQQPASIIALYRRALSFATEHTNFKIVGIVEDNVIETVARLDISSDDSSDVPDLENARKKLITNMEETLASIQLKSEIDDVIIEGSPTWEVKSGHIAEIVREYIESEHPGIVFVRSVAEISENLDPFAEIVTRQVLQEGFNCLIVWD